MIGDFLEALFTVYIGLRTVLGRLKELQFVLQEMTSSDNDDASGSSLHFNRRFGLSGKIGIFYIVDS